MTDEAKRLVNVLREDTEWAHANDGKSPIMLCGDLEAAADMIEKLSALLENPNRIFGQYSRPAAMGLTSSKRSAASGSAGRRRQSGTSA